MMSLVIGVGAADTVPPKPPRLHGTTMPATPYPARWFDSTGLVSERFGRLEFEARDGTRLSALTYRSTTFDAHDGPIWFVMHGASRDVDRYLAIAAPVAERYGALAITIHFTETDYPGSENYTLGVSTWGKADGSALDQERWREPHDYLYAELEHVFEAARTSLGGNQAGYYLFGHSAGAQFTHRLLTFLPIARVIGAVAANAGWYTLPVNIDTPAFTMPYGLHGTPVDENQVRALLASPLTVMLGERDTTTPATDDLVRGTPEAMQQGDSRLTRGQYYFATGRDRAADLGVNLGWRTALVPRAEHSAGQIIPSAAHFLFSPGQAPCEPTAAADARGIVITEVLADPPVGVAGDANLDGERDPQADEFIELVNAGDTPVCLAGWALGDAQKPERHVFPLGRALEPGRALIVFGGGVPTGGFGTAEVQWAAHDGQLSLTNAGDVLTLQDATGDSVAQLSWGSCDDAVCADEHIDNDLGIRSSVVRVGDRWEKHADVSPTDFSPGVRINGARW